MEDLKFINPSEPPTENFDLKQRDMSEVYDEKEYVYLVEVDSGYYEMNRVWIEDCFKTEAKALAFIDEYKKMHLESVKNCPPDPDDLFDYDDESVREDYIKAEREYYMYNSKYRYYIELNSVKVKKMLVK